MSINSVGAPSDVNQLAAQIMRRIDTNRDGQLSAGEFGAFPDANDVSVGNSDGAIVDNTEGKSHAFQRGNVDIDKQPVPHPPSP